MNDREMLTHIDGPMLAEAFPLQHRPAAILAGLDVSRRLSARQWTERFPVQVDDQIVLIPARLHFASHALVLPKRFEAGRFACALQTRSGDGFERQRAARDLLTGAEPWAAPFIVSLIGEYIVEILEDMFASMTPDLEHALATFIVSNRDFWETTKRRVVSYWNVYYRYGGRGSYLRNEYVGFKLINRLEAAASAHSTSTNG